jgi:hypothetical protein
MSSNERELRFKVTTDSSGATADIRGFRAALSQEVTGISREMGSGLSSVESISKGVFSNLANIRAGFNFLREGIQVVEGLATSVFNLAKDSADLGSKYHDLSLKSGLLVETISGLDLQLQQSGTDTNALANGMLFLERNIGGAARGNEELRRALAQVGITDYNAALNDSDGTLRKVIKSLGSMTSEGQRNVLGSQIMGKAYKELAVFIADTGGDMDAVIAKARELGLVMSTDAANKADEFGDKLDEVNRQLGAVKRELGEQLMPLVKESLDELSRRLKDGGQARRTFIDDLKEINDQGNAFAAWLDRTTGFNITGFGNRATPQERREANAADPFGPGGSARGGGFVNAPSDVAVVSEAGEQQDAMAASVKAAALHSKAVQESLRAEQTAAETNYRKALDRALSLYKATGDYVTYIGTAKKAEADRWAARQVQLRAEESEVMKRSVTEAEAQKLKDAELGTLRAKRESEEAAFRKRMADLDEEAGNKSLERLQLQHRREMEILEMQAQDYIEHQRHLADTGAISYITAAARVDTETQYIFDERKKRLQAERDLAIGNKEAWEEITHQLKVLNEQREQFERKGGERLTTAIGQYIDRITEAGERANRELRELRENIEFLPEDQRKAMMPGVDLSPIPQGKGPWVDPATVGPPPDFTAHISAIQEFKNVANEAFQGITLGFGSMLQAFLEGGDLSGRAFLRMAKSVIAGIAAQAAVKAIFELAEGWAALANPLTAWQAPMHFTAAKIYGLVAGVAAGTALAIPGGKGNGSAAGSYASGSQGTGESSSASPNNRTFRYGDSATSASDEMSGGARGHGPMGQVLAEVINHIRATEARDNQRTALVVQSMREVSGALRPFTTASPTDIVQMAADTINGQRAIGVAAHRHMGESPSWREGIGRIAEGYGWQGPDP